MEGDPYVRVLFNNAALTNPHTRLKRTKVVRKTCSPVWGAPGQHEPGDTQILGIAANVADANKQMITVANLLLLLLLLYLLLLLLLLLLPSSSSFFFCR
jgi:hypothetical protein